MGLFQSSTREHDLLRDKGQGGLTLHLNLILTVLALVCFGTVMVYSVVSGTTVVLWQNPFMQKHFLGIILGLVALYITLKIPMSFWFKHSDKIFWGSVLLLILVFLPVVGHHAKGAARWVNLGFFKLQVSELVKVTVILMAASYAVRRQDLMHSMSRGLLPVLGMMCFPMGLLICQPDLGATVVVAASFLGVLFLGGLSWGIFISAGGIAVVGVAYMIWSTPWRLQRFFAYLHPWDKDYVLGKGYQLTHSLIAIGRGEISGVGLGQSVEKQNYLPEAHTDFIFAVIGEETGFVGTVVLLFLFYWLIRYAFEIGRQSIKLERFFPGLLAQGIGFWIGCQMCFNLGVASGTLPTKGLTLPFISYGGSAMMCGLFAIGLLLRVDYENKYLMRGGQV